MPHEHERENTGRRSWTCLNRERAMAQIEIYQEVVIIDERGHRTQYDDRTRHSLRPLTVGHIFESSQPVVAAGAAVATLWSSAQPGFATFEWLMLRSDLDGVEVELVTDTDGSVGTVAATITLERDIWYQLPSNQSRALNTGNFDGTLDVIDTVRAKNSHATIDAVVDIVLAL